MRSKTKSTGHITISEKLAESQVDGPDRDPTNGHEHKVPHEVLDLVTEKIRQFGAPVPHFSQAR